MEIEKKYLTKKIPFDITSYPKKEISQCYISTKPTIRLRKSDDEYILTVKGSGKIAREEFELNISEEEYLRLKKKSETSDVIKTRYFVPINNIYTAEVDIYHGISEGLITTEVEFNTIEEAENFISPEWFGKDISLDPKYKNTFLALYGKPE